MSDDNPFELYDLDPREGIAAITQRLKELAEDAKTDEERERIRTAWEELTLHPARRQRAALHAHPETRSPLGLPPSLPRRRPPPPPPTLEPGGGSPSSDIDFVDLAARPSLLSLLGIVVDAKSQQDEPNEGESENESESENKTAIERTTAALDRDPIL